MSIQQLDDPLGSEPNVMAYRIGAVERELINLRNQFDGFASKYPSSEVLQLMLAPITATVHEVKKDMDSLSAERKQETVERVKEQRQLRHTLIVAAVSPLFGALVTIVLMISGVGKS